MGFCNVWGSNHSSCCLVCGFSCFVRNITLIAMLWWIDGQGASSHILIQISIFVGNGKMGYSQDAMGWDGMVLVGPAALAWMAVFIPDQWITWNFNPFKIDRGLRITRKTVRLLFDSNVHIGEQQVLVARLWCWYRHCFDGQPPPRCAPSFSSSLLWGEIRLRTCRY